MKKVLIARPIYELIGREKSFLKRADLRVTTASTNDDLLAACRAEPPDLIISQLDLSGRDSVEVFEALRDGGMLKKAAVIMVHAGRPGESELAQQCSADAVLRMPVDPAQLQKRAQHLLEIPSRESFRVLLSVKVDGQKNESPFFCRSENISVTGLLLETDRTLSLGDRVECSFFLPGSRQIVLRGEIVRKVAAAAEHVTDRYGIRFIGPSSEAKASIEKFVESKLKMMRS